MLSVISLFCLVVLSSGALALDDTSPKPFAPVQGGYVNSATQVLPYAPDRILVQLRDINLEKSNVMALGLDKGDRFPSNLTGIASIDALAADAGVISIERPYSRSKNPQKSAATGKDRWFMFRFENVEDIADLADEFRRDPNVQSASLDWLAFPAAVPSDPMFVDNWGHNNTAQLPDLDWGGSYEHDLPNTVGTVGFDANTPGAWDSGYGTSSVVIAILDSGVEVGHPDLRQVTGYDFGDNDTNPDDNSGNAGHGTACAGVAAAINNGVGAVGAAGGCSIMPCKVADSAGSMYFSAIQDAIYWSADNGADIISMSLGAAISSDSATDAALQYAYNAGCTILAATGNENMSTISYPAINQYVIAVGAASPCGDRKRSSSSSGEVNPGVSTDPNGYTCDGERWWGSNYGTTTADLRTSVDILGPTILPTTDIMGSAGYDTGDYSGFFNGTSCATPFVAGVAALVKSQNPGYTPAQIRDALVSTAQDVVNVEAGTGWDRYSGYGMVDAAAALGGGTPVLPVANFTGAPTSGTMPLNVAFTDQSTGSPTSWSWTFGDGGTSTAQNPSYTYTSAGTYSVSLTVSNANGNDTFTRNGYISVGTPPAPTADFSANPTSGEFPLVVAFTDQSAGAPTSWSWTFGDGGTATSANPSHTYTAAGTYDVTLTVTNAYGNDSLTRNGYITVTEPGTSTWQTITYDDFEGGFGNYTDGGGDCFLYTSGTYARQGSNAAGIQDNSGVASSFFHTNGYDVSDFTELEVEFWFYAYSMDNSNEDFWLQYYDGSTWQTIATWARTLDFENNTFYNKVVSIPKSLYSYPANAQLRFMCDASGNADDIYIDELEFRGFGSGGGTTPTPPVADFSATPTSGTAPLAVAFTDLSTGSPTNWSWTFGDGGTSTAQNPSYSYTVAGTYSVSLTATNADGSDAETKTGYIVVTEPSTGGWEVITYDDFEGGLGNYTDGGGDMSLYTSGTYAYEGRNAANIQDNSGTASSFYHSAGHDVSAYVDLEVEFYFLPISMENGEDFWVQYYNGSAWQTVATFVAGTDVSNNQFYVSTVNIPAASYTYPTNARLRFLCDASGNRDDVYIDNIEFRGLASGGAGGDFIQGDVVAARYELNQNYPNPFNPMTEISFRLPSESHVSLTVFNVRGEAISTLVDETRGAGLHHVTWDGRNHPSGVYFYQVNAPGFSETRKMIMLK